MENKNFISSYISNFYIISNSVNKKVDRKKYDCFINWCINYFNHHKKGKKQCRLTTIMNKE